MELNFEKNNIKKLFLNILLKKGKKTKSEKILKNIFKNIKKKTKNNANDILFQAVNNLLPKVKLIEKNKTFKKNKKNQFKTHFLIFLNPEKQILSSIKWLLENSKNNSNIIKEIIYTSKKKSKTIHFKKKYYKELKKLKFNISI